MKKINKFLALSFLLSVGSMHIVKTEENKSDDYNNVEYDDQDVFGQDCYESQYEEDCKAFCDMLLHAKIQDFKELMIPGNEIPFMNFLMPNKDLGDDFYDNNFDYLQSCTYLHILTMCFGSEEFFYLQQNYSDNEFKESRCKIIELIQYALEIGVDVNAKNLFNYTPLHLAILNSLYQFQTRCNDYGLLEYYDKPLPDWKSVIFINSNVELVQVLLAAGANVNIYFESEKGFQSLLEFLDQPKNDMAQYEKIMDTEVHNADELECKEIYQSLMPSFEIVNVLMQEFAAIKKLIKSFDLMQ